MAAIYQAREGPPVDLTPHFRDRLDAFRRLCEQHRDSTHEKTRALAREFLNDWEAIWIVVAHPYLPLTNNDSSRLSPQLPSPQIRRQPVAGARGCLCAARR